MKNGLYAKYKGIEYSTSVKEDGSYILRSNSIEAMKYGFSLYRNKIYIKNVQVSDISGVYQISTFGEYNGLMFQIINEKEDLYYISKMDGNFSELIDMGMKENDKGIYQKWVKKAEVKSIHEEKNDLQSI